MQHPPVISAAAGNVALPGPGGVPTMEQHIQQTNERLQCIHQYLETQAMFASSAKELLEWCRDERAFQKPFEQGLMACLTVIHKVAGQPGYDLNLAYRLMAVCASHRNKLTPKFASLLSSWFDDLSRLQFMRQQQGGDIMQADRVPPPQPLISDSTIPLQELSHTPRPSTVNWQGNHIPPPSQPPPPPQGAGPHSSQSLSIVTTVWGGVSATQQQQQQQQQHQQGAPPPPPPPLSTTTTSTSAVSSAQMSAQPQQTGATVRYAPPPPPPPPPPPSSDNPMYQGGFAPGNTRGNGLPPPPPPPPDGTGQASGGPAAAAAAAAVAAAAATATATATAHATARIQQQEEERRRLAHQAHVSGHGQQPGSYPGPAAYFPKQYPGQGMEQGIYPRPPPTGQARPNQPMYAQHPTWQQQQQQHAQQSQVPPPPPQQQADQQHRQQGMRSFPAPFNRPQQLTFGYSDQQPLHQQPSPHGYGPPPGQGMGPQSSVFPQMAGTPEGIPPGFPDPNRLPPQQFIERQKRPYASGPGQYGYGPPPPPPPQPEAQQMGLPGQPPSYIAAAQSPQFVKPPSYPSPFMTQGPPTGPRRPSLPPYPGPGGARAPIGQEPVGGAPYGSSVYNPPPADQSGMINRQPPPPPPPPPPGGGGPEIKPEPETKPETLRLSFPVRDGAVLNPFRLQHNLSVSNHAFFLKDQVYGTLDSRSDLELQFKCYHHEDKLVQTNWPAAVSVSVNTHPVHIERGDGRSAHKPLYIKNLCQAGRNTIQISVTACCCSHLFVLQLVHRPSINSVLQSLIKKRLLAVDLCIQKIRANFAATNQLGNQTGVEQTSIKVSLKCPLSFRRITFPARGRECRHVQCFDLESYLQLNCERGTWKCPVCSKPVSLEYIEVDQFIWGILTTIGKSNEVDEVMIDPDCHWKPVAPLSNVKSEPDDSGGSFAKMRKLDEDNNVAGFRFPDRRPHGSGAGLPMLSASAPSTGQHPPSSADYSHPHYQTSAESTGQQMQQPPPPPPERFPPPYQRTYSPRAAQQQLQQQQQPGPPPMLPQQQAPPPSLSSGPNFQPLMPAQSPFSAKKVDQSGSGTRSGPGTPLGPAGISGQQLPAAQSVGSVPTTSTLADGGERIGNPGTPLVDIDPSTFCTGGPGSNAPPSNISVTANVLSVRNFPSADDGGIDLLDGSEDLLGDLGDLGDLADDSEIFKIFDSAP